MRVVFAETNNVAGKLADAELHFSGGPLDGLKLVGFGVWERKNGGRNVTFPARQYSVNGERRSYALLRPSSEQAKAEQLRDLILAAFKEHEETQQEANMRDFPGATTAPARTSAVAARF